MEKDSDSMTTEVANKTKTVTAYPIFNRQSTFGRNKVTGKPEYKMGLTTLTEQALFSNLCDLVEYPIWNSVPFDSLKTLGNAIGQHNQYRLSQFLHKAESLNYIRILTENKNRRIYINPDIFYKGVPIKEFTFILFGCNYTTDRPNKDKNKQKVNIEKQDKSKSLPIGF